MILLDYRDKRPIYEQVVEKLEHLIVGGALGANEKMPSVRSLGMELTVNPNTIQRAYNQLEQDGYLYTIAGRGSFCGTGNGMAYRQDEEGSGGMVSGDADSDGSRACQRRIAGKTGADL